MVYCEYTSDEIKSQHSSDTHRLAWLMSPFPPSMGTTEVDAVLKDTTSPSFRKGGS